jgi:hypothetical protein
MPLNSYFLQGSQSEQRLVQDLINEQLKIYGQDVVYLPRKMVNKKTILREVVASTFDDSFRMEAYLLNYQGFEGSGDILSKFGVQTTDSVTFIISKERYEDFISPFLVNQSDIQLSTRPQEGDLIYFPLDNTMFEIKYVEGKKPFYQLNNLYVYQLSCEVMDYALDDNIDTSIEEVDESVVDFGYITKLNLAGAGASTASVDVQLAKTLSVLQTGKSVSAIDLISDGTGYTVPPLIGIATAPSTGINATAVAIMTSRSGQVGSSIDRIEITNPGFGYTEVPIITIRSQNAFGTGAAATAIINEGTLGAITINDGGTGYGSTPVVSIGTAPSGGINASASAVVNTLGEVSAIRFTNAGAGYTLAPTISVSSPNTGGIGTGDYLFKELVRGVSTGTTAYVAEWDSDVSILKVTTVSGNFALGEVLVGIGTTQNGSDASYTIQSISTQDEYDTFAENIEVETEADAILDFTEKNPFGEF